MAESKKQQRDTLPESFASLDELWDFWDSRSTADYEDLMDEVDVNVDIRSSRVYCAVAKELAAKLRTQAQRQGVTTETLINLWLSEKVAESVQSK